MLNRRTVLAAMSGAIAGFATNRMLASSPSLRLIGRMQTVCALLDTGSSRILFVSGSYDERMLEALPGLKTFGGRRVDLVVGSYRNLGTRAARNAFALDSTPAIAICRHYSLPPLRGDITHIVSELSLEIGGRTGIRITPVISIGREDDDPDFGVDIDYGTNAIRLLSDVTVQRHLPDRHLGILVVPGNPANMYSSAGIADHILCTQPEQNGASSGQIPLFSTDPLVIDLHEDGYSVRANQPWF